MEKWSAGKHKKESTVTGEWILIGRSSSHYTRVVRVIAAELGVVYELEPLYDFMTEQTAAFAGNPALKMPVLKRGQVTVFGTLNICRTLAREEAADEKFFWPDEARTVLLMNAHELLAHAMAAEVEVVLHEIIAKRPEDAPSRKRRQSMLNCLLWLDRNLEDLRSQFPGCRLSYFDVCLYCLVTHLPFRLAMDLSGMPALVEFGKSFGERASAQATPYRYDQR